MIPLRIHCITADGELSRLWSARISEQVWAESVVVQWPEVDLRRNGHAEQITPFLLLDLDSLAERAEPIIREHAAVPALLIGGKQHATALCAVHNATGCEFLLRDGENLYLDVLACTIRKVLRERDRDETAADIVRSTEKRYEELIQVVPDIVYKIDPAGHFTFINNAVTQLGYTPRELIGKHFSILLHTDDVSRVSRKSILPEMRGSITGPQSAPGLFDERRTGDRRTLGLELRVRRKGGPSPTDMLSSVTAYGEIAATGHYRTESQTQFFTGTVGIIRDITQRKRSEEMLHRLSVAIEQSKTAVCIAGADGTVEYANPYFLRLNGFRPEDVLEQDIFRLLREYLQDDTAREVESALRSESVWEGDSIVWRRDGESYWSWIKTYPVSGGDGQVHSFIFFQEDITDRKQTEAWLRDRLQDRERLVERLHEEMNSNLQLLADLQAVRQDADGTEPTAADISHCMTRIFSVALVHEIAQQSGPGNEVDFRRYLNALLPRIARDHRIDPVSLSAEIGFDQWLLPVGSAMPLGLLVHELLSCLLTAAQVRYLQIDAEQSNGEQRLVIRHPGGDLFAAPPDAAPSATARAAHTGANAITLRIASLLASHLGGAFHHESFRHEAAEGGRYTASFGGST